MEDKGIVCVTGAAGFVGSSLVKCLLEQGYTVKATVRDPSNLKKVKHLLDLPNANSRLTLWKAELCDDGSFDDVVQECVGVFHVATPTDFTVKDPENETIKPAIEGVLNMLKSCTKSSTVRRVIYTSSAGAVSVEEHRKQIYDEDCWSDVDFCKNLKMVGWMYFASKTLAEKAGFEFAKKNNIDFVSIIPTLVNGPFFMPTLPPSMLTALALITGNAPHYSALNPIQFNHIDDLCQAQIFLFEHPKAVGRYICSSHDITLPNLATMLRERYPQYDIPTEFEGITEFSETIKFSSKKLMELGFEFKYSLEDMFDGAINSCIERGLLPLEIKKDEVI